MKESIHKYFKVGTIQWMSFPNSAPLDSLLAIARDDYFDAVELTGYGVDRSFLVRRPSYNKYFLKASRKNGLWHVICCNL